MRVGIFSDVHSHRPEHVADIAALVQRIAETADLDLLICAGDISHEPEEVRLFLSALRTGVPKAWVPGNHDIWVLDGKYGDDAEYRYRTLLPKISKDAGWHYLPQAILPLPAHGMAVVGTIGWSAAIGFSEWFDRPAGEADERLAAKFADDLARAVASAALADRLIVVTHHLPHRACVDESRANPLRHASVNEHVADVLKRHADRVRLVVHGHHHRRRETRADGLWFVAHPFGYPGEHARLEDGFRVVEVPG